MFHKVKHPYEEDDEQGTYYTKCLKKADNDNFSPDYIQLSRKLPHDIYSLPQVLAQRNKIMNILFQHLKSCEMESLQSALE